MSRKPLSSTKTRWAPRRAAFFYPRPFAVLPARNGGLIALDRAALGLLTAPAQGRQHLPDVARMVVHAELLVDQFGHSRQVQRSVVCPARSGPFPSKRTSWRFWPRDNPGGRPGVGLGASPGRPSR